MAAAVIIDAGHLAVLLGRLVRPLGDPPGPGSVAGLAVPAPLGRRADHRRGRPVVSGPDHPARARQGHAPPGTPTGYRSGWSRASPPPTSPSARTTWPRGSAPCCAGSAPLGPGAVVLEFVRRDALAALIPAVPIPAHPDLKALPVGRREDGLPWLVRLHGTHVLVAGATGAGKASLLWGLVRAMFPLMQAGLVRVLAADPKLMELAYGRVIFDTLRPLRRRPGIDRRHARHGCRRHAGPGGPVRRAPTRPHPDRGGPVRRGAGR